MLFSPYSLIIFIICIQVFVTSQLLNTIIILQLSINKIISVYSTLLSHCLSHAHARARALTHSLILTRILSFALFFTLSYNFLSISSQIKLTYSRTVIALYLFKKHKLYNWQNIFHYIRNHANY